MAFSTVCLQADVFNGTMDGAGVVEPTYAQRWIDLEGVQYVRVAWMAELWTDGAQMTIEVHCNTYGPTGSLLATYELCNTDPEYVEYDLAQGAGAWTQFPNAVNAAGDVLMFVRGVGNPGVQATFHWVDLQFR